MSAGMTVAEARRRRCPACDGVGLHLAWVSIARGLDYVPCDICHGEGSIMIVIEPEAEAEEEAASAAGA